MIQLRVVRCGGRKRRVCLAIAMPQPLGNDVARVAQCVRAREGLVRRAVRLAVQVAGQEDGCPRCARGSWLTPLVCRGDEEFGAVLARLLPRVAEVRIHQDQGRAGLDNA